MPTRVRGPRLLGHIRVAEAKRIAEVEKLPRAEFFLRIVRQAATELHQMSKKQQEKIFRGNKVNRLMKNNIPSPDLPGYNAETLLSTGSEKALPDTERALAFLEEEHAVCTNAGFMGEFANAFDRAFAEDCFFTDNGALPKTQKFPNVLAC